MRSRLAVEQTGTETISNEDKGSLASLAMDYIEPRDRFGLMSEEIKAKVVETRRRLRQTLENDPGEKISFIGRGSQVDVVVCGEPDLAVTVAVGDAVHGPNTIIATLA